MLELPAGTANSSLSHTRPVLSHEYVSLHEAERGLVHWPRTDIDQRCVWPVRCRHYPIGRIGGRVGG